MEKRNILTTVTIALTKARIEKGLLAIPREFTKHFPNENARIQISLGGKDFSEHTFTTIDSSARESRVCGLGKFFRVSEAKVGDMVKMSVLEGGAYSLELVKGGSE